MDNKLPRINFDLNRDLDFKDYTIIPIGNNCNSSIFLRNCRIKGVTYPYDWATNVNVDEIIHSINNKDTFNIMNWYRLHDKSRYLPHDKDNDSHGLIENSFLNVDCTEKYKRRFERLFSDIYLKNVILFHHYSNENEKLSLEQKEQFKNINKSISFIEINNFQEIQEQGQEYNMYVNKMLSLFKPNIITSFIKDFMSEIYENNKIKYPYNYNNLYYDYLKKLIEKYNLKHNLFPETDANIIFYEKNCIVKFLGNYLLKEYKNMELLQ